ncbi:MAG: GTP 3',8-cyclase MoaA [Thermodesulfobacteriota bacterium]
MLNQKLIDQYNRVLNYLRVSITDHCNLRCMYCVPREEIPWLTHDQILTYEEILRLIKIGAGMGIAKVRITGGEPLVRKGVYDFLSDLNRINGISDVSLTTNGVLLADNIDRIRAAGIRRINVSLDTLNRRKYKEITGHDQYEQVWRGILSAHAAGLGPIKINVVALKGINDDELIDFARLSMVYPFHIRFIEHMPIGASGAKIGHHLLAPEIKARLETLGRLIPVEKGLYDGPAERYKYRDAPGEIGFIRPLSRHFCAHCNRLRLTASGQLRTCLLSDNQVDLKGPLRRGCSDSELVEILLNAVRHKPSEHHLSGNCTGNVNSQMSSIGG